MKPRLFLCVALTALILWTAASPALAASTVPITQGRLDAITFTSSSTVEFFIRGVGPAFMKERAERIEAVSIGPITSAALRAHGIEPAAEASEHTIQGLVEALHRLLGAAQ